MPRFTPPDAGLINPDINEGLPPFLSSDAGLSSGYMIAHVAAAALLNECKVLTHPASVDSVPTSGGKEDHVSMGMIAALKLRQVVENLEQALAIEILCATQGLDYRKPLRPGEIAGREMGLDENDDQRAERDLPKLAPDGLESLRSAML